MAINSDTFSDLLNITEDPLKPLVIQLKELILTIDPNSVEVVRLGDRAVTFGIGPKKMSDGYVYIMPHKNWVNLGFYQGAHLPDPMSLLEGTGKNMRHIKIKTLNKDKVAAIKQLITKAKDERLSNR